MRNNNQQQRMNNQHQRMSNHDSFQMGGNSSFLMFLAGIGTSAALMYFIDRDRGRARRSLVGDKVTGLTNNAQNAIGKTSRDLSNRAKGLYAESRKVVAGSAEGSNDTVEKSIVVNVPLSTAYNQWTQFEEFPQFMEGIKEVRQLDDKRLHWRANIAGKDVEWEAEIGEQKPNKHISWRSTTGAHNAGAVGFMEEAAGQTRITLRLDYEPKGFFENVGSTLGFVDNRVEGDLQRFKTFIESRGSESGGWRGEIHNSQVQSGS